MKLCDSVIADVLSPEGSTMQSGSRSRISILSLFNIIAGTAVFITVFPVIESRSQMSPDPMLSGAVVLLLAWAMIGIRSEACERIFWTGFLVSGIVFLLICEIVLAGLQGLLARTGLHESATAFLAWLFALAAGGCFAFAGGSHARRRFCQDWTSASKSRTEQRDKHEVAEP